MRFVSSQNVQKHNLTPIYILFKHIWKTLLSIYLQTYLELIILKKKHSCLT